MILVDNYFLAILCCVICCACWGSWANTQKMVAAKQWSFELFYWDLTVGLFLTALLGIPPHRFYAASLSEFLSFSKHPVLNLKTIEAMIIKRVTAITDHTTILCSIGISILTVTHPTQILKIML